MVELHFATEIEPEAEIGAIECSWNSVIHGIERYAAYQATRAADDLREWAALLEGLRQLREED